MNSGMLWYDGEKQKTLDRKVTEAALRFKKKYGRTPDMCLINTKDSKKLPEGTSNQVDVGGHTITICSWKGVVPGHLWIGFENEPEVVQPEPKEAPVKSDVVSAFERHAQTLAPAASVGEVSA